MEMMGEWKMSLDATTKHSIWLLGVTASICLLMLSRSYSMFLNILTYETISLRMLSTCAVKPAN
jgi:hypothetical protein